MQTVTYDAKLSPYTFELFEKQFFNFDIKLLALDLFRAVVLFHVTYAGFNCEMRFSDRVFNQKVCSFVERKRFSRFARKLIQKYEFC